MKPSHRRIPYRSCLGVLEIGLAIAALAMPPPLLLQMPQVFETHYRYSLPRTPLHASPRLTSVLHQDNRRLPEVCLHKRRIEDSYATRSTSENRGYRFRY